MRIKPLRSSHASVAAELHMAGQPNTFLTSLGHDVLSVLYMALPQTSAGFGFVAMPDGEPQTASTNIKVMGFVSATASVGRLFWEIGIGHFVRFVPPLTYRLLSHPALLLRIGQTLVYPLTSGRNGDSDMDGGQTSAELLSIMVHPALRGQQVGSGLMDSLLEECRARDYDCIVVTVAADNMGARRFYHRHGFEHHSDFKLYGRSMCGYRRGL